MSNIATMDYQRQGLVFTAANVSAKSVIAVTTSMTGVILYNPIGSAKKLVIISAGWAWTTAPAAVHNIGMALMASNVTVPTTLTAIGSGVLACDGSGSGNSVARAWDAAALPVAPVMARVSFGATYGTAVAIGPSALIDYIDGALALVPGAALTFAAVTTTAVGLGSVTWLEVPA